VRDRRYLPAPRCVGPSRLRRGVCQTVARDGGDRRLGRRHDENPVLGGGSLVDQVCLDIPEAGCASRRAARNNGVLIVGLPIAAHRHRDLPAL
jgi:hypothetical protein